VDAGRPDRDEEAAVEAGVARGDGPVTGVGVEIHGLIFPHERRLRVADFGHGR
jgi:hypothetical protein